MASNSVKIIDIYKVAPVHDSTESAGETTLSPTFFELAYLRFIPSQSVFFFKHTNSTHTFFHSVIFPKLKQSLSHTLLHFLPVAGCLTWPPNTCKPIFVYLPNHDAVSVTLAESNDEIDRFISNGIREAIESHPYAPPLHGTDTRTPLLALQVTLFPNKGFCIGVATHHAIFDGKSTSMFLRAWAYTCKYVVATDEIPHSLPEEITPSFDWTTIKDPEGLEEVFLDMWANLETRRNLGSDSNMKTAKPFPCFEMRPDILRATFQLTSEDIKKIRESVLLYHPPVTEPAKRLHLSPYVLTVAYTSICLVKARGGDTNREVYLVWSADCRSRLDPPLRPNHFGDCVVVHHIAAKAGDFMQDNGIAIIAEKLSGSIKGLEKGLFEGSKERLGWLFSLGPEVQATSVTGSTGLGFYNMDFGWGNVKKIEVNSIDRSSTFSILDTTDGSELRIEIGVALTRPEIEAFASLFSEGLKVMQSKFK